jgi:adenosine deaminase
MSLQPADIAKVILAGFKSAFLPFHIKQVYLRRVASELEQFVKTPLALVDAEPERAAARSGPPLPDQRTSPRQVR